MSFYESFCNFSVIIVTIQIIRSVIPWIYENFLGPAIFGSSIKFKDFGKWAVVTGATDGIGKAYCEQLAEKGLNIILVSRTLEKLKSVAIQIEKAYKVQTKVIAVDFTKVEGIYEKIEEEIEGLEIGVLVNNVGMCLEEPKYFLQMPNSKEICDQIIHCNVTSVVQMTRIILPQMVERQKGLIINISSITSLVPTPLITVYGSTKSFVTKFSDDLRLEYKQHGVTIQTMCPFFVSTNMIKSRTTSWDVPSPSTFVRSALRSVAISEKTTGYYIHALQCIYLKVFNYLLPSLYRRAIINTMENIIEVREKTN